MKFFCCGFCKDKWMITHKKFQPYRKNLIAVQEYTFHVTVPRMLFTFKSRYQHEKALISPIFLHPLRKMKNQSTAPTSNLI